MLIVVDPQIDFISGSLPVPGAAEAMNQLADYVKANGDDYALMVVTNDWHPYDHCSFAPNGGPWPVHCVQNSEGAATYWPLLEALYQSETETLFCKRATCVTARNTLSFRTLARVSFSRTRSTIHCLPMPIANISTWTCAVSLAMCACSTRFATCSPLWVPTACECSLALRHRSTAVRHFRCLSTKTASPHYNIYTTNSNKLTQEI